MQIAVVVHPNSKQTKVEKDLLGTCHVYVKAPPLEGKANEAAIETLADFLKIKKNRVILLRGAKSKNKVFEVKSN